MLLVFLVVVARATSGGWIKVPKTDCAYWDVSPQPACNTNTTVAALMACCLATPGCEGFNTHGVLKRTDCHLHEAPQSSVDLYLIPGTPPPPGPRPPAPFCERVPSPMPPSRIYHRLPGTDIDFHLKPLCVANTTSLVLLRALCDVTPGCAAFTHGTDGGPLARGSYLFSVGDEDKTTANAAVDLHVLGPARAQNVTAITPKPLRQTFPSGPLQCVALSQKAFSVKATGKTNTILDKAMARYTKLTFLGNEIRTDRTKGLCATACTVLAVDVLSEDGTFPLGTDESYTMEVSAARGCSIKAPTVFGALRAMETFSQVVVRGGGNGAGGDGTDEFFADAQTIDDAPQYTYRGLMIDTARHFLPLALIFATIDGMAYDKLNTLHWHAVDDQSFPLEVSALPDLAKRGAFSFPSHSYSRADIARVVEYGAERGVRVMVEVDTPGHSQVLGQAYPAKGLVTDCPGVGGTWPPLDVSNPNTTAFVQAIWDSLLPLFPIEEVFIGGDECHTDCWAANPAVAAWAAKMGLSLGGTGNGTVFGWWIDRVVDMLHGKRPVMWSPLQWDPSAAPSKLVQSNAILNLWTGSINELAYNITKTGTNQLITSVNWYLPTNTYNWDPQDACSSQEGSPFECSAEQRARIIGGEACMWGEGTDKTNFFRNVWPDMTGAAERLWSPKSPQGGLDLMSGHNLRRLRIHRCRFVTRGLPLSAMASVYVPTAGQAQYATWREWQWCPGDAHFDYNPLGL